MVHVHISEYLGYCRGVRDIGMASSPPLALMGLGSVGVRLAYEAGFVVAKITKVSD
jgi:hypothetical protein